MNDAEQLKHNRLVTVATLHYLHGRTHAQIAAQLGLSRVKVTRLLKEAVNGRIVEFRIADPVAATVDLSLGLEKRFGLKRAIVVPGDGQIDRLGREAASLMMSLLAPGLQIGMGWGNTLNAMVPHLYDAGVGDVSVISLTGGLAANAAQSNPYDIVTQVAGRIRAAARYLLVPALVRDPAARSALIADRPAADVLSRWDRLDACFLSIGQLSADTGIYYALDNGGEEVRRVRACGGVGDLLAKPFNADGRFIGAEFTSAIVAAGFEQIRRARTVAGVAGGSEKIACVLGALRTGLMNVLITDEACARGVVKAAG